MIYSITIDYIINMNENKLHQRGPITAIARIETLIHIHKQSRQSLFHLGMKLKSFLAILTFLALSTSFAFGLENSVLVGTYELNGVMEVAGMLQLNEDQKYLAQFIYGSADWTEAGLWKIEGDEVVLAESRILRQNMDIPSPVLPTGIRFTYGDGKLTAFLSGEKIIFMDPTKTPSVPQGNSFECKPYTGSSLMIEEGSLLSVGETEVIVSEIMMRKDFIVKRAWAEKNIPELLSPPQLYKRVKKEISASDIICLRPIISGEGRMRVRGLVVKIDSELLVVEMGYCFDFNVNRLPKPVLKAAREKKGQSIDVEIPYSAMISSGGCLRQ